MIFTDTSVLPLQCFMGTNPRYASGPSSEGHQASTTGSKLAAVLHSHPVDVQKEFPTSSPLSTRARKGGERSYIAAGTPKRVRHRISWRPLLGGHCLPQLRGPGSRVLGTCLSLDDSFVTRSGELFLSASLAVHPVRYSLPHRTSWQ